jgi:hypothetical protein
MPQLQGAAGAIEAGHDGRPRRAARTRLRPRGSEGAEMSDQLHLDPAARRLVSPARPRVCSRVRGRSHAGIIRGKARQPGRNRRVPAAGAPLSPKPAGLRGSYWQGVAPCGIVVGVVQTDRAGWEEHHAGVGPAAARRRRVVRPAVSGRRRNHPVVGVGPNWRQWFCPLVMANWRAWRMVAGMLLGRPLRLQDVQRVGDQGSATNARMPRPTRVTTRQ